MDVVRLQALHLRLSEGTIKRHILPLIGSRRAKDIVTADIIHIMRGIPAGGRKSIRRLRIMAARSPVASSTLSIRTGGFLGAILTYAHELGIIEVNPAHDSAYTRGVLKGRNHERAP